ncbi:MAG: DNA mismatch repair endonuclease MutL [Deltaproteobacteria bacterium]|nr:DNA mismatch repair endonuclease MutL [Deltaproteobacteria bacterium]
MQRRIEKLDEETISKISAGEVILRPSNAVKELIENSIDADADFIELEILKGGKELIRVTDNGCGINREDLPLTIERFATSKIRKIEDLSSTLTMGFRGEALASIAAVSRMTIISSDGNQGYKMEVENSQITSITETASAKGTTVIIKDLFYNIPVRRKFLKTDQTEMIAVTDVFMRYVISNPGIHFRFLSSKRLLEEYFVQKDYLLRILSAFRECPREEMNEYYRKTDYISLRFICSSRNFSRNDNRYIYTFVNNRYVNDRLLKKAITDAYSNILPPQKYPAAVLLLNIDPGETDINIHPQKTEIRFRDTTRVYTEVFSAVSGIIKTRSYNFPADSSLNYNYTLQPNISHLKEKTENRYNPESDNLKNGSTYIVNKPENIFQESGFFSSLKILTQLGERFIVLSSDNSIVIIDQHAAQERILYNNIMKCIKEKKPHIQRMLIPVTVEMSPSLAERLRLFLPELGRTGFEIEIFSENTAVIKGIPVALSSDFSEDIFINIISSIDEEAGKDGTDAMLSEIAAKTACHASVRGRKTLTELEIRRLLVDMDKTDFSVACPHGRPVYFELKTDEIEKRLERR